MGARGNVSQIKELEAEKKVAGTATLARPGTGGAGGKGGISLDSESDDGDAGMAF